MRSYLWYGDNNNCNYDNVGINCDNEDDDGNDDVNEHDGNTVDNDNDHDDLSLFYPLLLQNSDMFNM